MHPKTFTIATLAAVAGLGFATATNAATITEYFNDYGSSDISSIEGLNGGSGWGGNAWADVGSAGADSRTQYDAGTQLTYGAAGYSNFGNETDASDGAASSIVGSTSIVPRDFPSALTGTIWISALIGHNDVNDRLFFWLDTDSTINKTNSDNRVGIDAGTVSYEYNGVSGTGSAPSAGTHQLLVRIIMDASGANDSVSFWFDPDLTGGVGGLTNLVFSDSSADVFGADFTGIALQTIDAAGAGSNAGGEVFDQIRISSDPNAFTFVTTGVPEPASLTLLAIGGVAMLRRRRA